MIRRVGRAIVALIFSALATSAAYMAFLGWDQRKVLGPDGQLHGPYQAWQVIAFGAVVALIAARLAWIGHVLIAVVGCTVTVTGAWSVDAATDPLDDGLWPLGAVFVATGVLAGTLAITSLVARARRRAWLRTVSSGSSARASATPRPG
jgi:hypothetical protein